MSAFDDDVDDDLDEHEYVEHDEHEHVCCPQCGGEPALLGQLGRTVHLRCIGCGWDFTEDEGVRVHVDEGVTT